MTMEIFLDDHGLHQSLTLRFCTSRTVHLSNILVVSLTPVWQDFIIPVLERTWQQEERIRSRRIVPFKTEFGRRIVAWRCGRIL